MAKIEIFSWEARSRRWLAVDSAATERTAQDAVARRYRVAREQGIGGAAFCANETVPTESPEDMGLEITPEVERSAPAPRPAKPVGKDQPGARDVTLQVRGHVDDSDVVWFGSMCWPRDIFEAAGGVVIENGPQP